MHRLMAMATMLLACLCFVTGCKQDVKNVWKTTKKYYGEYLNTPAELEFDEADVSSVEERLAIAYTPIGMALENFRRDLANQDVFPTDEWGEGMLEKYSWLSGIAVIDTEGSVLLRQPEMGLKALDFSPLLQQDAKLRKRDLRAYAENNPLGPEVYLGQPFFVGNEMKGVVVAHFDVRNLLTLSPKPLEVAVLSPEHVLWPGKFVVEGTPLANQNWKELLKEEASDSIENDTGEFLWIGKFLGNLPLVFATTADAFPVDPDVQFAPPGRLEKMPEMVMAETAPVEKSSVVQETLPSQEESVEPVAVAGSQPETVVPALHEKPEPPAPTSDYVWSVQIGSFQNLQYAQDRIALLQKKGLSPCLMKLYDKHGQLWNVVQIGDYRSKSAAYSRVAEYLRVHAGFDYNVEILDAGVVSRRKECF